MSALIESLIRDNQITREQVQDAKDKQIGAKKPLQDLLVDMGFISEEDLIAAAAVVFNAEVVNLEETNIDPQAARIIPYEVAKQYGVLPISIKNDEIVLAMSDINDVIALDNIRLMVDKEIKPVLSKKSDITRFLNKHFQSQDSLYDLLKNIAEDAKIKVIRETESGEDAVDITLSASTGPVVRLVNLILGDASRERASDIHIEPQERIVEVRYRIDGYLKNIMKVPGELHCELIARIKILAQLDITETRKPQDGRARLMINDRKIDLRISIIPTFFGEKIVIRLLDIKGKMIQIESVGLSGDEINKIKPQLLKPQGIILVTGPTGSGKTSTLYAALNHINSEEKNIITIEDPIEYLLEGINQMQVNPLKELTFATGLRSILRQDPNVILVGEIRDKETADIAFRAAQTGHLVFSTLHTNDAVSTVTRLLDIGLQPFIIASSLNLIVAQRLVRLICPDCKQQYSPDKNTIEAFSEILASFPIEKFYQGKGCRKCDYTGYLGREAIFEILEVDESIKSLISSNSPQEKIFAQARGNNMKILVESAMLKVASGITTLEEISNVVTIKKIPKALIQPQAEKKDKETGVKTKILIVDDEDSIRMVLKKRIIDAGYEVIEAVNGKEGVEKAVTNKPDLIIMDLMMPVMDGITATKELRLKLATAGIPVVMLTAKQDKTSELEGLDAGADDYLTKPFDKDKLLARVKMLIKRRGLNA